MEVEWGSSGYTPLNASLFIGGGVLQVENNDAAKGRFPIAVTKDVCKT